MTRPPDPDWEPQLRFTARFWVGCTVVLLSVSFLVVASLALRDARSLNAHGVPVQAVVLEAHEGQSTGDRSAFRLTYRFELANEHHIHTRSVPESVFCARPKGTEWTIQILPKAPEIHDLYPNQTRGNARGFVLVTLLMTLAGGAFMLSGGNLASLRARRFRTGT